MGGGLAPPPIAYGPEGTKAILCKFCIHIEMYMFLKPANPTWKIALKNSKMSPEKLCIQWKPETGKKHF